MAGRVLTVAAAWLALTFFLPDPATAQLAWPRTPHATPPMHQAPGGGAPGQIVSTTPHPAVARIIVPEKDGQSYGSGTLVDVNGQHGLVITNWHVVRDASAEITAVFPDGSRSPAQVVKVDQDWDLAALSVWRPTTASPVPVSPLAPKPGESLTIAGYGSGDYRAAAGVCTQYLAPSEKHPYELVEVAAEARQGDSGGPIFNERGELAGVLFGSGPGYTSGSYAGRVKEFLASVIPADRNPAAYSGLAAAPPATTGSGTSLANTQPAPPPNALPQGPMANSPTADPVPPVPARLADIGMGFTAPSPLPLAPLASAPQTPAQPVPLIAESESRAFEAEPALTPVQPDSISGLGAREGEERVDPRTAITVDPQAPRDAFASDAGAMGARNELRRIDLNELESARPIDTGSDLGSAAAGRIAMVPHSPLPPREGLTPAEISNAPADQLLSAAWKRIGGTSFWDQAKTVLAIVGMLALLVQFWRFNSQPEPQPEAD